MKTTLLIFTIFLVVFRSSFAWFEHDDFIGKEFDCTSRPCDQFTDCPNAMDESNCGENHIIEIPYGKHCQDYGLQGITNLVECQESNEAIAAFGDPIYI